ncbi:MAG: sensor histidine kinase [Dorea sp.]|nr:sensor histidine kinase [Ruminococcus sp.]MCI9076456.1 sensor histidine kinase [Dorea sp.]
MKKECSLREGLLIRFLIATLIPILLFSAATQMNMVRAQRKGLEDQIESNLRTSTQGLDMLLDKYSSVLYDLCTDETILDAVEYMNDLSDILGANRSVVRRGLNHACSRTEGIVGIMFSLSGGDTIFFDALNSSSTNSSWIEEAGVPEVEKEYVYRGIPKAVYANGEKIYIFQIARKLVDYRDIHRELGTAVISIEESQVCEAIDSGGDDRSYLLDGSQILSAVSKEEIGRNYGELVDLKANQYTSFTNEKCGYTICNVQPMGEYRRSIQIQYLVLTVIAGITILIVFAATFSVTKPYLRIVDNYKEAMDRLQKGDFTVCVETQEGMAPELRNIAEGFNEMVVHMQDLIRQGKQAALEQKNAEMSALEAQIDPHFLYNTLDTINWKAIENEQYDISEMLGALADILRYIVKNAGGTTTLSQELEWLEHYLLLQSVKLGKKPELQIKVPEELMETRIHKLLLQPFVENAIKYAFTGRDTGNMLVIRAKEIENQIHLSIGDNGRGIEPELLKRLNDESADLGEHMGIVNVRKRLKLYYGEEATVYFESIVNSYTRVHLFMPIRASHMEYPSGERTANVVR